MTKLERGIWYDRIQLYNMGYDARDLKEGVDTGELWTELKDDIFKWRLL